MIDERGVTVNNIFGMTDDYDGTMGVVLTQDRTARTFAECMDTLRAEYGTPSELIADNAQEYIGKEARAYCARHDIRLKTTAPYHPNQNRQESSWSILRPKVRILLSQMGTAGTNKFKGLAYQHAALIHNLTPSETGGGRMSPYEARHGKKPHVGNLRTWGCLALRTPTPAEYATGSKEALNQPGFYIGHNRYNQAYLVYDIRKGTVFSTIDVKFMEEVSAGKYNEFKMERANSYRPRKENPIQATDDPVWEDSGGRTLGETYQQALRDDGIPIPDIGDLGIDTSEVGGVDWNEAPEFEPPPERPTRTRQPNVRYMSPKPAAQHRNLHGDHIMSPVTVGSESSIGMIDDLAEEMMGDRETEEEPGNGEDEEQSREGPRDDTPENGDEILVQEAMMALQDGKLTADQAWAFTMALAEKTNDSDIANPRTEWRKVADIKIPTTAREVIMHQYAAEWLMAQDAEIAQLDENGTATLEILPEGVTPLQCKFVYDAKSDREGYLEKFKARLVAKGFLQRKGVDYDLVFAPTVQHTTTRILAAYAKKKGFRRYQDDVVGAYLKALADRPMYMKPPKGYEKYNEKGQLLYWKLLKGLYGLKQAARLWNRTLIAWLRENGWRRSRFDPSLLYCNTSRGFMAICIFVDDFEAVAEFESDWVDFCKRFNEAFPTKGKGEAQALEWSLGHRHTNTENHLYIDQTLYIDELVEKYLEEGPDADKPAMTPMPAEPLTPDDCPEPGSPEAEMMKLKPYRQLVGTLNYAAVCTRPDISYAVSMLSRYFANPGRKHWKAAQQTVRYLRTTRDWGLAYSKDAPLTPIGHVDSAFCTEPRGRSRGGYAITVANGGIAWQSYTEASPATSTAHAEYMSLYKAVTSIMYIRGLLRELGEPCTEPSIIWEDNAAAIKIGSDHYITKGNRHFEAKLHYTREMADAGEIVVKYVATKQQVADALTKPGTAETMANLRIGSGMRPVPSGPIPEGGLEGEATSSREYANIARTIIKRLSNMSNTTRGWNRFPPERTYDTYRSEWTEQPLNGIPPYRFGEPGGTRVNKSDNTERMDQAEGAMVQPGTAVRPTITNNDRTPNDDRQGEAGPGLAEGDGHRTNMGQSPALAAPAREANRTRQGSTPLGEGQDDRLARPRLYHQEPPSYLARTTTSLGPSPTNKTAGIGTGQTHDPGTNLDRAGTAGPADPREGLVPRTGAACPADPRWVPMPKPPTAPHPWTTDQGPRDPDGTDTH